MHHTLHTNTTIATAAAVGLCWQILCYRCKHHLPKLRVQLLLLSLLLLVVAAAVVVDLVVEVLPLKVSITT